MLHELFSLSSASGTETVAVPQTDGSYKLHGFKWFTSATDADMTLTLARVQDKTGATIPVLLTSVTKHCQWIVEWYNWLLFSVPQGSKGLSLFYAEVSRDEDGRLRGIEVQRLKDKLGTRQMPTAELLLDGLPARRVSYTCWVIGYNNLSPICADMSNCLNTHTQKQVMCSNDKHLCARWKNSQWFYLPLLSNKKVHTVLCKNTNQLL